MAKPSDPLANIAARLERIEQRLDEIERAVGRRGAETHFYHLHLAVQSLVRHAFIDPQALPYPERLIAQRFRLRSQNYEDGITLALAQHLGIAEGKAVEIGCGMNGGNCGFLVAELGWRGLFIDSDAEKLEILRATLSRDRAVLAQAQISVENVNDLVESHGFGSDIDVLSLDIDGVDYWIWEALRVTPRVMIVEYNSAFGPEASVTIRYRPDFRRAAHRLYFGASLSAFVRLGQRKGYRLVAVEPRGVNAFFVRDDLAPDIPAVSASESFRLLEKHRLAMGDRDVAALFAEFEEKKLGLESVE